MNDGMPPVISYRPTWTNLCGWNAGVETTRLTTYAVTLVLSIQFRDPVDYIQLVQDIMI